MGTGFAAGVRDKIRAQLWRRKVMSSTANAAANAEICIAFARKTNYAGPTVSGDHVYGWPIAALIQRVLPSLDKAAQIVALVEIHKRSMLLNPAPPLAAPTPLPAAHVSPNYTFEERLAMRMQWARVSEGAEWAPGFLHIAMRGVHDKVHVWVITLRDQSVVLEDEMALFPTDALIAKLNMLKE